MIDVFVCRRLLTVASLAFSPMRQTATGLGIVWKPAHRGNLIAFFLYLLKYRNPVAQKPQKVSGVLEPFNRCFRVPF